MAIANRAQGNTIRLDRKEDSHNLPVKSQACLINNADLLHNLNCHLTTEKELSGVTSPGPVAKKQPLIKTYHMYTSNILAYWHAET